MKNKIISFFAGIVISIYSFGASAVTEVVWWDFLGGGDGVRMKQLIDNFSLELNNFIQVCPKEMLDKLENPISFKPIIKEVI